MAETFNPDQHLMKLKGKDYLEVKWRLVWMLQATSPRAGYLTIELEHDRQNGYARYAAIAWDGSDETWRTITLYGMTLQVCGRVGTGIKTETRADFQDFAEKAETGALGRALAGIGFGTQFSPDVEEGHRLADSPVQPRQPPQQRPQQPQPQRPPVQPRPALQAVKAPPAQEGPRPVNDAQRDRITELSGHLKRNVPNLDAMTFEDASRLITSLQADWRDAQAKQAEAHKDVQPANEQQLTSIRKLCAALGREEPDPAQLTFTSAGAFIRQLSKAYNLRRQQGNQSA